MRIAITGVTGFIGRHLATRALERGHDVRAFSRRPWTGPPYVPLADRHFLELPARPGPGALDQVDAIVHLAIASQSASDDVVDSVNRLGTEEVDRSRQDVRRRSVRVRVVPVGPCRRRVRVRAFEARSRGGERRRPGLRDRAGRAWCTETPTSDWSPRTARTAAKLRVFPVIGGDAARVQPIDVDELCDALIALATMSDPPRSVMLGDPTARPLGDFVRSEAQRYHGIAPKPVNVSIGAARTAVRLASRLHLPLPISEANIAGIEAYEPMDTAADVEMMAKIVREMDGSLVSPETVEPRKLILIGSGRVGLVHALTAAHHQRMVLAGIVDLNKAAMLRLTALAGPRLATFTDLDVALRVIRPDAAIISTPPSSHVPLAAQAARGRRRRVGGEAGRRLDRRPPRPRRGDRPNTPTATSRRVTSRACCRTSRCSPPRCAPAGSGRRSRSKGTHSCPGSKRAWPSNATCGSSTRASAAAAPS